MDRISNTSDRTPRVTNLAAFVEHGHYLRVATAAVGLALFWISFAAGAWRFPIAWTALSIPLVAWPLTKTAGSNGRRMIVAGGVMLLALLVAWRLDAQTNLGVLALAGNRDAVIGLMLLVGVLGMVTASWWWLVLQSGVWAAAIALSAWWLQFQPDGRTVLNEWRTVLPEKQQSQLLDMPIPRPFALADALWLGAGTAVVFAAAAGVGVLIRKIARNGLPSIHPSLVQIAALVMWPIVLLPINQGDAIWALLLLVAAIAGATARRFRELALLPAVLVGGLLLADGLEAAWYGLLHWWGPIRCEDWLFATDCNPSQQAFWVIILALLIMTAAAIGYGVRRLIARRSTGRARPHSAAQ